MSDVLNSAEQSTLRYYDEMLQLNQLMLTAAQSSDWDAVIELEQRCQKVVDELRPLTLLVTKNRAFLDQKMRLIRFILELDAEIRDLAAPRLKQLESAIRGPRTARRLAHAYGSSSLGA